MTDDIWNYVSAWQKNSSNVPQLAEPDRQLIVETEEEVYLAVSGDSVLWAIGLYEYPASIEPKQIDRKQIVRWCYFSDFVKGILNNK